MNVLIVDDEPIITRLLTKFVSEMGHTVDAFTDPHKAYHSFLEKHHPIALINWLMPGMSGIEMTKKIRKVAEGKNTAILIVSALDLRRHMDEFLDSGADDFLGKPLDHEILRIRIAIAARKVRKYQLRSED